MMKEEPDVFLDFAAAEAVPLNPTQQNVVDPLNSGFLWYKPPMGADPQEKTTGGHKWAVVGNDMQVLAMTLPSGEKVVTEIGSFMFGSPELKTSVELTLCGSGGCGEGCNRICGGESCVKVLLVNEGNAEGFVGITPNFPAKIIPIQFGKHIQSGEYLIAQPGAYLSHVGDVDVGCSLDCSPTTCCCAGFGCCRQKLSGSDGSVAFLNAGGTIVYRELQDGESIIVDNHSVVAIEQNVGMGIAYNGRLCTCCFGGEGCCSTSLTGPGKVFMQSMNFYKFQAAVQQTVIEDRGASNSNQNQTQNAGN